MDKFHTLTEAELMNIDGDLILDQRDLHMLVLDMIEGKNYGIKSNDEHTNFLTVYRRNQEILYITFLGGAFNKQTSFWCSINMIPKIEYCENVRIDKLTLGDMQWISSEIYNLAVLIEIPKRFTGLIEKVDESETVMDKKDKYIKIPLFVIESFESRENTIKDALDTRTKGKQDFSGWSAYSTEELEYRLQEVQHTISVIHQYVKGEFMNEQ